MAVPRKGWRKIVVDHRNYFWRALGRDHPGEAWPGGIDVVVVTAAAFERGRRSQQLLFSLRYDHERTAVAGGDRLRQRTAIGPAVVARALELAPEFSGAIDEPDIELGTDQVEELQALAVLD